MSLFISLRNVRTGCNATEKFRFDINTWASRPRQTVCCFNKRWIKMGNLFRLYILYLYIYIYTFADMIYLSAARYIVMPSTVKAFANYSFLRVCMSAFLWNFSPISPFPCLSYHTYLNTIRTLQPKRCHNGNFTVNDDKFDMPTFDFQWNKLSVMG